MLKLACLWISHRTNTTRRTPSKHLSPRTGLLTLHTHTHTVYPKIIAIGFDKSLVLHTLSLYLSLLSIFLCLSLLGWWQRCQSPWVCLLQSWLASSLVCLCSTAPRASSVSFTCSQLFHKTLYITKVHIMHSTAVVTSPSPGELQCAFVLAQY